MKTVYFLSFSIPCCKLGMRNCDFRREPGNKIKQFKETKHAYIEFILDEKTFKGCVVNRTILVNHKPKPKNCLKLYSDNQKNVK